MSPAVLKLKLSNNNLWENSEGKYIYIYTLFRPNSFSVFTPINFSNTKPAQLLNQTKILNSNPNNQRWIAWKLNAQNLGPIAFAMYSDIGVSRSKKDTHTYQSSLVCVNSQTRRHFPQASASKQAYKWT
jgi:hypothetical protein